MACRAIEAAVGPGSFARMLCACSRASLGRDNAKRSKSNGSSPFRSTEAATHESLARRREQASTSAGSIDQYPK